MLAVLSYINKGWLCVFISVYNFRVASNSFRCMRVGKMLPLFCVLISFICLSVPVLIL